MARVAVWGFGVIIAVNQIGIATSLVNILFMGFVGALALALGLSFGLGGRETAGEIVSEWYRRGAEDASKIESGTYARTYIDASQQDANRSLISRYKLQPGRLPVGLERFRF